jgi:hypothetical protein
MASEIQGITAQSIVFRTGSQVIILKMLACLKASAIYV